MKYKYLKTIVLLVSFMGNTYAQDVASQVPDSKNFLTFSDNKEWITKLDAMSDKSVQLYYIKDKIKGDANYTTNNFVHKDDYWENLVLNENEVEEDGSENETSKANCDCKIKFNLVLETSEYELDATKYSFVDEIINNLSASKIDTILVDNKFVKDDKMSTAGTCGVVYIYSEDRRLKRLLRRLLKD